MKKISETTNRKFIDTININDWNIKSDTGWIPISHIHKTIEYQEWVIITESGKSLICADTHIIFDENFNEIYVKDCVPLKSKIITIDGIERILSVIETDVYSNMYDLTVESEEHRFYTNDILSHNSTFIDAICFSLYGKPFRKINKNQLINSINKNNLVAEIEFSIGSIKYKVIRGIKPNIFEVYCNDTLVMQDAKVRDYQEQLERYILKMSYKSFTQVVILGSARYTPFMQLSAADRRSVIEDLLDIQVFSNMNSIVKDELADIKDKLKDVKFNIESYKDKIEVQKYNINQNKKTNEDIILRKHEVIANTLVEMEDNIKTVSELTEENARLLKEIIDFDFVTNKKNKLDSIDFKITGNISKLKKENVFFTDNNNCPTCRQIIDDEFKNSIISKNIEKLNELESGNKKLKEEYETLESRLAKIKQINVIISNNNHEIGKVNSSVTSAQKYITLVDKEIQELETVNNTNTDDGAEKLQQLMSSLDLYIEKYEEYLNDKNYYDFISIMLKDGGIKTRIIKQYLPILNKYINQYLSQMDFFVNFNIDENFDEVIKSRHRDEFTYANFSEGEKMRLDLAILFSFRQLAKLKNSVNTNLLILDEIMDSSLDTGGTDVLMDLISTFDNGTHIFVITHKSDQISDKFDMVLRAEKIKNFSRIRVLQ